MKKLDIYGGLLGSGKTTLIKKMLQTAYQGFRVAIIENEIGKINLDSQEFTDIQVRTLTSGCVCCTLKGNMIAAIKQLLDTVEPDYIIVEATGAADLQTIKSICLQLKEVQLNRCIMLVNAKKITALLKVVGTFYYEQLLQADTVYLNFTEGLTKEKTAEIKNFIYQINPKATIISTPLSEITSDTFPEFSEVSKSLPLQTKLPHKKTHQLKIVNTAKEHSHIMSRTSQETALYTWTYELQTPFTEETLQEFWEAVKRNEIWRVKGIVAMSDGTIRKIDYAFGDIFEAPHHLKDTSVLNKIVFIGKEANMQKYIYDLDKHF